MSMYPDWLKQSTYSHLTIHLLLLTLTFQIMAFLGKLGDWISPVFSIHPTRPYPQRAQHTINEHSTATLQAKPLTEMLRHSPQRKHWRSLTAHWRTLTLKNRAKRKYPRANPPGPSEGAQVVFYRYLTACRGKLADKTMFLHKNGTKKTRADRKGLHLHSLHINKQKIAEAVRVELAAKDCCETSSTKNRQGKADPRKKM